MDRDGFVRLSLLAFGIVVLSFVLLGFGRLVLPFRTAQTIAAPVGLAGFVLVAYLFLRATLSVLGIVPIHDG